MARWDYQRHGGVYRDVQSEAIERLITRHELGADDKVAFSGTDQWTAIKEVPAFSSALQRAANFIQNSEAERLPDLNSGNGLRFYWIWFLLMVALSYYSWHEADSYNPEGNGMFNSAEAALSNRAWLQVIASLLTALFSSIFIATSIIASRLQTLASINRSGFNMMREEIRRSRVV